MRSRARLVIAALVALGCAPVVIGSDSGQRPIECVIIRNAKAWKSFVDPRFRVATKDAICGFRAYPIHSCVELVGRPQGGAQKARSLLDCGFLQIKTDQTWTEPLVSRDSDWGEEIRLRGRLVWYPERTTGSESADVATDETPGQVIPAHFELVVDEIFRNAPGC